MTVSLLIRKMIDFYDGNLHDIRHFMKVWAYAKLIGELEGLDAETQETLEIGAIVHDIACPLCREKYGYADGAKQEAEGMPLARVFLQSTGLTEETIERAVYLVGHHHTLTNVKGLDYQILLEADYLVNADEGGFSRENIESTLKSVYKTAAGISLLKSVYKV